MAERDRKRAYLKPNEVAEMLRVETGTVRAWAQSGGLRATTTPGGHRRFAYRDVVAFARQHKLSLAMPSGEALRTLIVDDDAQIRALLKRMLTSVGGIEVDVAHDGFSAGQLLARFQPNVVLLDLFMPGINGIELCRNLKADPTTADIRIIAMTGASDPEAIARVLEYGAERCLTKPISKRELLDALGIATEEPVATAPV